MLLDSFTKFKDDEELKKVGLIQKKVIKYLILANISIVAFATTKDIHVLEMLLISKGNFVNFLYSDILNCCGIKVWQFLLMSSSVLPIQIIDIRMKSKSNKRSKK